MNDHTRNTFVSLRIILFVALFGFAVMLTFSTPRIAFAQETATVSDMLTAKADAQRDADAEVKPYIWVGHGCSLSVLGIMTGIASVIAAEHYFPDSNCLTPLISMAGGYLLTTSVGIKTVYSYRPDPPAARFIGKSPEYIDTYISTYKSTRGHKQTEWVAGGCFLGTLMSSITLYTLIVEQVDIGHEIRFSIHLPNGDPIPD